MRGEFAFSFGLTAVCLIGAGYYGFSTGGVPAMLSFLLIAAILGVMEVSLSFDNAVVNASVLRNMTPLWQRRFLTWGIAIAVFGMRFLFPIVIVAIIAGLGFGEVVRMAFADPEAYSRNLEAAHVPISAFGGAFLMMVFLKYLMDPEKDVHWFGVLEERLAKIGRLEAIQIFITGTLLLLAVNFLVAPEERLSALTSGMVGLLTYVLIDALGGLFDADNIAANAGKAGAMSFLYLEVLDASFSLDGVIGAFAITKDVVVIAAGLAIGAAFVRSLTLLLVRKGTLQQYIFLEHGAHYGIGSLAIIMLLSMSHDIHIPEVITGLIGLAFIVGAVLWSLRHRRIYPNQADGEPSA
ncbi:hypothetical protein HNR42_000381 [Deinobacterium chartae]|uniref:DUF475 domain-containing protein n=1 Tax=Deinobacterium chartae TaxID=521158 RepID=A0A841HXK6_9DEIO|nr:DUF475 domain-containing protein [Deinobacterium chartae]MBB6096969.1 hypothetical protein [Deinobacterium chartae]